MPSRKPFRPPKHISKEWPEVFEHIYMNSMPIRYIHGVELEFRDGRIWEVDISEQLPFSHEDDIVERLMSALNEMAGDIIGINFNIDVEKLKVDIQDQTKNIMKDED